MFNDTVAPKIILMVLKQSLCVALASSDPVQVFQDFFLRWGPN